MDRKTWRELDGANRRAIRCNAMADFNVPYIARTKGRDLGRRESQEARLRILRAHALRDLRQPEGPDTHPEVARVMDLLGRKPYCHSHQAVRKDYRRHVRATLANSGFASLWMREAALRCLLSFRDVANAYRMAA